MPTRVVQWGGLQSVHPTRLEAGRGRKVVNLELTDENLLRPFREPQVVAGAPGTPYNHAMGTIAGASYIFVADSSEVTAIDIDTLAVTTVQSVSAPDGYLEVFGGDLYFVSEAELFKWDGVTVYDMGLPQVTAASTNRSLAIRDAASAAGGRKQGSCTVSFAAFDSKRRIYGPRSDIDMAVVYYVVGHHRFPYDGSAFYRIELDAPALPGTGPQGGTSSADKIAVFVSFGPSVFPPRVYTPITDPTCGPDGLQMFEVAACTIVPAVQIVTGDAMAVSDLPMFERFVDPSEANVQLDNSQQELSIKGVASDAFEPPLPSKHFAILPQGLALYFEPDTGSGPVQQLVEWSVSHPEQIARINDLNRQPRVQGVGRESRGQVYGLKGEPIAFHEAAGRKFCLTRVGVYALGFNGVPTASEVVSGWGAVSRKASSKSLTGIHYASEAGHIAIRGGQVQRLDSSGYSNFIEAMIDNGFTDVACGNHDATGKLFLFSDVVVDGNEKTVFVDYHRNFVGTIDLGDVEYMVDAGPQMIYWDGGVAKQFPGSSATYLDGEIELWINDDPHVAKTIEMMALDVAEIAGGGQVTVTVEAYDHPDDAVLESNSRILTLGNRRHLLNDLIAGLTGRFFRVLLQTEGLCEIGQLQYQYEPQLENISGR